MAPSKHPLFPDRPSEPTTDQISAALSACLATQERGQAQGKRPFGAVLLGPDHTTVLLTHFSISHVEHAEASIARLSTLHFSQEYLWQCTLVSTWEPCAMCAGTMYWANIGRLVYAASEETLAKLTGEGNEENMTLTLPCRELFARGQKGIKVVGPVGGWEEKVATQSDKYWGPLREKK
ncbi:cytidine deaminase-like protein [Lophium mytilinum]|uniref:Cytidine deaminase-like protein n=1 Tax=Lophium mytilinum TaxID=390894 RepID=A0A6A6R9M8_9PEZI|nr:cytidine deaminase-like protein [Lophium mytilinum]